MRRRATREVWLDTLLIAVTVAGLVALVLRPGGGADGVLIESRDPAPGIDEIRVQVAGAVLQPTVVTAPAGSRVIDAIESAGGFAPDADREALNLSRRVVDEDRIVVPHVGETFSLLDVNVAAPEELETLPGIGPARAAAIVEERIQHGDYATTDDLVRRGVVPPSVYDGIRDLVTAR